MYIHMQKGEGKVSNIFQKNKMIQAVYNVTRKGQAAYGE